MSKNFIKDLKYDWKLYLSTSENSNLFFNSVIPNNELVACNEYFKKLKNPGVMNNANYILKTNEIIYNNIKTNKNKWYFYDFLRKKNYCVYNIIFQYNKETEAPLIIFIINKNNPTIIIQNAGYTEIFYIGYIKEKILIQISHSTSGCHTQLPFIENILPYITNVSYSNEQLSYKQFIFIGFNINVGHHLWNELSGLNIFLQNPHLFNKINGICIGPYDFFNIENYLKNNYNFKIIKYDNGSNICQLSIFPIFLNSFILDKNIPQIFNKILNYKNTEKPIDTLQIGIDIRTAYRNLLNMSTLYTTIINYIYNKYNTKYKIIIHFLGRFQTNVNNININDDKEYLDQNDIVNNIINLINNNNIIYNNLIGKHFSVIFNETMHTDFNICIGGTSISNLMNWIYTDKKIICLCNKRFYTLINEIQYDCLQNYNVFLPPIESVIDDNNENFYIDETIFFPFLFDKLNSFDL
jgi:hypothetical protein